MADKQEKVMECLDKVILIKLVKKLGREVQ
jgi:hypothetical protein